MKCGALPSSFAFICFPDSKQASIYCWVDRESFLVVGWPSPFEVWVGYDNARLPGRVAQTVGHLTRKSGVLVSIPGLATYFRFFFRFFKKGSCQVLAKVCARSTG